MFVYGFYWLVATVAIAGTLLSIAIIDLRSFRIPNVLNFLLFAIGLGWAAFGFGPQDIFFHALAACAGYLLIYFCNLAYKILRGVEGIGMGDAKLLAAGGALLGLTSLPVITLIATCTALLCVVLGRINGDQINASTALPFGPFLAFAIWILWLWNAPFEVYSLVRFYV